jgi:hypothetical protein
MSACSPVLFLVFNRPEQTTRVFNSIRAARPARLYVAADGPRRDRPGEAERCAQVRKIATSVDWPCQLHTLMRDRNLGCGVAVSEAIDWIFSKEEEAIILEDDCLPDQSFFNYCTTLLGRFRGDQRVGQICGFNLLPDVSPRESDYFPTHFGWCWGWATWKRAWSGFDPRMQSWSDLKRMGLHRQHPFYRERVRIFDVESGLGVMNTWDYQWHYALASQGLLSMVPVVNLVQNIGFVGEATHTVDSDPLRSRLSESLAVINGLRHPQFMLANPAYEQALIRAAHPGFWRGRFVPKARRLLAKMRANRR